MSDQNDFDGIHRDDMLHGQREEEETAPSPIGSLVYEEMDSELAFPLLEESFTANDENVQEIIIGIKSSWQGPLLLLGASFLYATLNISLRAIYSQPGPPSASALSMTRGWLNVGLFLPLWIHKQYNKRASTPSSSPVRQHHQDPTFEKSMWIVAAELAFWNFVGQGLYTSGIQFCPSARASFLGQTSVVLVPLICALRGEALRWWDGIGCLCSLIGIILLSMQEEPKDSPDTPANNYNNNSSYTDKGGDEPQFRLGFGDILILASTVCWCFYLIKTSQYAKYFDAVYLQGSKHAMLSLLYSAWFILSLLRSDTSQWPGWHNGITWAILVYSAIGPGVLADLIQQKGQESAGATESNLILCMESLFTAILGRILLGEETSWIEKLGGTFLVAGAVVSSLE